MRLFPRSTLQRCALEVAPNLLGALLVTELDGEQVVARLVEVEAYDGANDPASHAYRGRSARNAVMFGVAGHGYVYFTYGMHHCINVVCGPEGVASAVLLRAAAIVTGADVVRARRAGVSDRDLARGPGRLCRALGIDRSLDGVDLCDPSSPLRLARGAPCAGDDIRQGLRVGISRATELPWRWWIDGEPAVSAYRIGTRATRLRSGDRAGSSGAV